MSPVNQAWHELSRVASRATAVDNTLRNELGAHARLVSQWDRAAMPGLAARCAVLRQPITAGRRTALSPFAKNSSRVCCLYLNHQRLKHSTSIRFNCVTECFYPSGDPGRRFYERYSYLKKIFCSIVDRK